MLHQWKHARPAAILAVVALSLSGCSPMPEKVKGVLQDKDDYLASKFGVDSVPAEILDKVRAVDDRQVNFKKMVLTFKSEMKAQGKPEVQTAKVVDNFQSLGGSLVRNVSTISVNGIATSESYDVSYRGFLALVWQKVVFANTRSNFRFKLKSLDSIADLSASSTQKTYSYTYGYADPMNLPMLTFSNPGQYVCTQKATREASVINAALKGRGIDYSCEMRNKNDITSEIDSMTYLEEYGLMIYLERSAAAFTTTFTLDSVEVQ